MATQTLTGDRRHFLAAGLATVVAVGAAPALFAEPVNPRAAWDAAMNRYRMAEPFSTSYRASDAELDELLAARKALLDMSAPDHAALRWKLDELLVVDDGETAAWREDMVRQTIRDYRRLLAA